MSTRPTIKGARIEKLILLAVTLGPIVAVLILILTILTDILT